MSGFTELTFVEYDFHNAEVMVDVDVDTKEVIGIYTYDRDNLELFEDAEEEFKVKWKVGKNKLFTHVTTDLEMAFKALCNEGFVCGGVEGEEEELFLSDFYLKYDLGHMIESY